MNVRPAKAQDKKIFEPATIEDLVRGWMIHAHKGRDRHDEAARKYDRYRFWLGGPTVALSAIVGTSIFISMESKVDPRAGILFGLISIISSVLAGLQTLLNFAERAEKHRVAGVKYKELIRELEQLVAESKKHLETPGESFTDIRKRLDALELAAPVVSARIYKSIEKKYSGVAFIEKAAQLYQ
jgi:conflict system pore-forming effector with SLATT domain